MKIDEAIDLFISYCKLLYQRGFVRGVGGNLSLRIEDNIIITPTGVSLRDVTEENIVIMREDGRIIRGESPTKDVGLHMRIMKKRKDINCVCHVHGDYIISASVLLNPGESSLPPITPGFVYFAYPLPMLPFMVPGSDKLVDAVSNYFSNKRIHALLLQNHGLISIGRTFYEAMNIIEEIDEAARVYLITGGRGNVINNKQIKEIKMLKGS